MPAKPSSGLLAAPPAAEIMTLVRTFNADSSAAVGAGARPGLGLGHDGAAHCAQARTPNSAAVAEATQLQLAAPPAAWTMQCHIECRPGVSAAAGASA